VCAALQAGSTPLHWAARGGHIECVARLLAADNVEVNAQNKMGDTALHGAAWKGETQVTTMLLEKGAHTNIKNNDGDIPYDLASKSVETQALLRSNQSCTLPVYPRACARCARCAGTAAPACSRTNSTARASAAGVLTTQRASVSSRPAVAQENEYGDSEDED